MGLTPADLPAWGWRQRRRWWVQHEGHGCDGFSCGAYSSCRRERERRDSVRALAEPVTSSRKRGRADPRTADVTGSARPVGAGYGSNVRAGARRASAHMERPLGSFGGRSFWCGRRRAFLHVCGQNCSTWSCCPCHHRFGETQAARGRRVACWASADGSQRPDCSSCPFSKDGGLWLWRRQGVPCGRSFGAVHSLRGGRGQGLCRCGAMGLSVLVKVGHAAFPWMLGR